MRGPLEILLLSLAPIVQAHGEHDPSQKPISGPHKRLWYNTLPGDGGTQVREAAEARGDWEMGNLPHPLGRFCLLRHFDLRSYYLPPVSRF